MICTQNCTGPLNTLREQFQISLDELNSLAGESPPGSEGVLVLPFFTGERTPFLPESKAKILGLSSNNWTRSNLIRSTMEGAIYSLRYGMEFFTQAGIQPKEVKLVGGGAKSQLWRQLCADILNVPVTTPEVTEAAAFGAALQAYWILLLDRKEKQNLNDIVGQHIKKGEKTDPILEDSKIHDAVFDSFKKEVHKMKRESA